MLRKEKTSIVFMPSAEEMYPEGFNSWVNVKKITDRLEGSYRPGHFTGVSTVVAKLFNIVEPTRAYFGQKDAQQALVIKKMVADLNMNLEVIVAPTVRESDGLAMSSRNVYLNPQERQAATVLFKALTLAHTRWKKGERNAEYIRHQMTSLINKEPLAKIEYISIADAQTLEELSKIDGPALASLAVRVGKTRLIDNILLE
jgi:pantoate--beta-alanine ligase